MCSVTVVKDVATVTPLGDIDLAATDELRAVLQTAMRDDTVTRIVVDLAGVTFVDSTALGVFVAAHTTAGRRGATFVLTNPGAIVTMVLTVTGLFDLLVAAEHQGTDEAAIA